MASLTYKVIDTFEVTNRGLVILGDAVCDAIKIGKVCEVLIVTPSGERLAGSGYKEWLLKRNPEPNEREAYLVTGLSKAQVPIGSTATITQQNSEPRA